MLHGTLELEGCADAKASVAVVYEIRLDIKKQKFPLMYISIQHTNASKV